MEFSKIAPYLQDPLILVGFVLFLFFGFGRTLLKTGIIPTLTRGGGESVLKKLILYGFLLAIAIIILGFGLKYRQLSTAEQTAAVRLIHDEIKSNMAVLSELALNTETILGASHTVATTIRHPDIPLMSGLFPESNLSTEPLPTLELARDALNTISGSKLLSDPLEQQKYTDSALLITTTIDNTIKTITSLTDENQNRYVLQNSAWQAHLPIMRKVTLVDSSEYQSLYSDIQLGRQDYNVMAVHARNYMSSLFSFFPMNNLLLMNTCWQLYWPMSGNFSRSPRLTALSSWIVLNAPRNLMAAFCPLFYSMHESTVILLMCLLNYISPRSLHRYIQCAFSK